MPTGTIGVLALQGAFREHQKMLGYLGCQTRLVRWPDDLEGLDGLVIPGGESTAIAKLLTLHDLYKPLRYAFAHGMGLFGTCAGAILLARTIEGGRPDQELLAIMDVSICRNGYGRQIDSFETSLSFEGIGSQPFKAICIRAPRFVHLGKAPRVVCRDKSGEPLAVVQERALAVVFHPELTSDTRVHRYFLEQVLGLSKLRSQEQVAALMSKEKQAGSFCYNGVRGEVCR